MQWTEVASWKICYNFNKSCRNFRNSAYSNTHAPTHLPTRARTHTRAHTHTHTHTHTQRLPNKVNYLFCCCHSLKDKKNVPYKLKCVITADDKNISHPIDRHSLLSRCFLPLFEELVIIVGNSLFIATFKLLRASWVMALDQGWRIYGTLAQNGVGNDFLGTRHALLSQFYFISFVRPASLHREEYVYIYTHLSA
jgi:hypothetical protein